MTDIAPSIPDQTATVAAYRARANTALAACLPTDNLNPQRLHRAMRYSTLNGGKRIRPVLVYAAGCAAGVAPERLDTTACAVELIHVYSLIHDDLPAMDNDDLRRGQPTCHKAFDDATAILAGDALQALAFQLLAQDASLSVAQSNAERVAILAQAVGSRGMVGGQALDLAAVGAALNLAELENMHIHKTGALIRASVLLGAHCMHAAVNRDGPALLEKLDHYSQCIGLAFQICDDILDVTADTATLGKVAGADQALNKPTYPALLGLNNAREHATRLCQEALVALTAFGSEADTLRWIASYIIKRGH